MTNSDASAGGWVKIYRALFIHPIFRSKVEASAFAWMIAQASWRPTRVRYKERTIDLERGQLAISSRDLAADFDWSEAKTRRYLNRLQRDAMIDARSDAGVNVITIRNYEEYQSPLDDSDAPHDALNDAPSTQERRTVDAQNKEFKKRRIEEGEAIEGRPKTDSRAKRGTRLAADWTPDSELRAWAWAKFREEAHVDANEVENLIGNEVEKFRDHWHALAGARAIKTDWGLTFKNWIRRAIEFRGSQAKRPKTSGGNALADAFADLRAEIGIESE